MVFHVSFCVKCFSWSKSIAVLFACSTIALIAGCGGGGGGTSSSNNALGPCAVTTTVGSLTYNTTWGSSPSNASQVIQIINVDGFVIRTDSVNRNGVSNSSITLTNLTSGIHMIRATLYSGANASGSTLGTASAILDLCSNGPGGANVTMDFSAGATVTDLSVAPTPITIKEQNLNQFVAIAKAGNSIGFLPPSDLNWSVQGGIGTVSSTGQFTATNIGNGTVTVNSNSTLLSGLAVVNVTQRTITQGKWTIIVFLNAANDLYSFSTLNMNQMEQVASNPDVRFVVQWKQSKTAFGGSSFDGVRRYLVKPDNTSAIASELVQNNVQDNFGNALDMGSPQVLNDFITWAKTNYPADRYALILWNHGNGWQRGLEDEQPTRAFSYDDQYGTSIKTWQTNQALNGHHFDIIGWDASLMQMIEVAYEARSYADYIVGSEESPPGEGYPYHLIFDNFRDTPDASTLTLAQAFVDGMQEQTLPGNIYQFRKITQSVLQTNQLSNVTAKLSVLADELSANRLGMVSQIQNIRATAQSYSPNSTRYYRDITDLCLKFEADSSGNVPTSVKTACADVRTALSQAVVYEFHNSQSPNSNGLSIDFSPNLTFSTYRSDYIQLKFAIDSQWDEWLSLAP